MVKQCHNAFKNSDEMAVTVDPDQTALNLHCLLRPYCPNIPLLEIPTIDFVFTENTELNDMRENYLIEKNEVSVVRISVCNVIGKLEEHCLQTYIV